jgi:hypothetical protein
MTKSKLDNDQKSFVVLALACFDNASIDRVLDPTKKAERTSTEGPNSLRRAPQGLP